MSIATDKVVKVSVLTAPQVPAEDNYSTMLLVESDPYMPTGQRLQAYPNLAAVAANHPTTSEFYKAAVVFFSQTPGATLLGGRRFAAPTNGELLSGAYDSVLADWTAITAGALKLPINGNLVSVTGLNFSGATTFNGIAAIIQTALAGVSAGTKVTYTGTRFYIQSGTTGVTSSVGYAVAPASGTDIAPLLAIRATDNGTIATAGFAAETVQQSLDALKALNNTWYGLVFTSEIVDADVLNIAAWAEANKRLFGVTTNSVASYDPTSTTDIGAKLQALNYEYTFVQFDPLVEYAAVSYMARLMAVDFTQSNSTITMMFKTEPGITPAAALTLAQTNVLDLKNINYYTPFGTTAIIARGVQSSGRYTDERQGLDWLSALIGSAVFNYLASTPTKVPQTDKGVARIVHIINQALDQAVNNGLIAEGTWNGNGIGTKKTGDVLPNGYYVYASPVSKQSQASFDTRTAPPITILAIGAGAIQGVNIQLNWQ